MNLLKVGRPTNKKAKAIEAVKDSEESTIRMNVNISKILHKQIKQKALNEDTTVTELVIKALYEYLSK